jgi:hypothetical protein
MSVVAFWSGWVRTARSGDEEDRDHRVPGHEGEAGWSDVRIDGHELACTIDWPGDDGIEARVATLAENELGRLLRRQLAEPEQAAVLADVHATLRDRVVDGALRLHASVWLVTARS